MSNQELKAKIVEMLAIYEVFHREEAKETMKQGKIPDGDMVATLFFALRKYEEVISFILKELDE